MRISYCATIGILFGSACSAEITNVRVVGATATQAVIAYTAPDYGVCRVDVSENADAAGAPTPPLVNDVRPELFGDGANRDDRPGNVSHDTDRVVVVGRRAAEKALDGRYYSRALQAYTTHYFAITCGDSQSAGVFTTANVTLGSTYPLPYPADPQNPGEYGWPTPHFSAGINEKLIDPLTGVQLVRLTGPRSFLPGDARNVPVLSNGVFDDSFGAQWSIAGSGALPAEWTGDETSSPKLYVAMDPTPVTGSSAFNASMSDVRQLDSIQLKVVAGSSGSGEDATVQICLTADGVSCASNAAPANLDLSQCERGCTLGAIGAGMEFWFNGLVKINGSDIAKRTTIASYDDATGALTWIKGNYFSNVLTAGSRVWIGGVPCKIAAVSGAKSITISPGLGLTNPVTVIGQQFGLLIWKKTASPARVRIADVKFNLGVSYGFTFWSGGQPRNCHPKKVQYAGRDGYHCVLSPAPASILVWIDAATGEANLLGQLSVPAGAGYSAGVIYTSSGAPFDTNDPNVIYGVLRSPLNLERVVRCAYSGDNSPRSNNTFNYGTPPDNWSCANLTPDPYDLAALIEKFDSRYVRRSFGCNVASVQKSKLHLNCSAGQDVQPGGWAVIYDLSIAPDAGNPVIAAMPTSGVGNPFPTPARWCVMHGMLDAGENTDWQLFSFNNAWGGVGFATGLAAPGVGAAATTIVTTAPPAVDVIKTGDIVSIDSEQMLVTSVVGPTEFVVQRGYGGTKIATHAEGARVLPLCGAITSIVGGSVWWNPIADPHGHNAGGDTVVADAGFNGGHRVYRNGRYVGWSGKPSCGDVSVECLRVRDGDISATVGASATTFVNINLPFAGAMNAAPYLFSSHISADVGISSTPEYVLDYRQAIGSGMSTPFSQVSGPLYTMPKPLDRKRVPTFAFCGSNPLVDISGPGSVLTANPSDNYKYCVALAAGECDPASAPGAVFFNCPGVSVSGCVGSELDNGEPPRDACIHDAPLAAGVLQQIRVDSGSDARGKGTRVLTAGLARYRRQIALDRNNGKALPGGEFALLEGRWVDDQRSDIYAAKLPPLPPANPDDPVDRTTFVPMTLQIQALPNVDNAVVEFGYDPDFFCTSRREPCVAVRPAIDESNPFFWASESFTGAPCAGGCTIQIPTISQRVVYYRVRYRDANGADIASSWPWVAVAP